MQLNDLPNSINNMAVPVIMPRQGQSVETCIITEWVKKKGDAVKKGDILFTYETDKASFETEALEDGILLDIFYNDGDEVPVLVNIAVIGKPGEDTSQFRSGKVATTAPAQPSAEAQVKQPTVAKQTTSGSEKLKVSPRARIMSEKLGINLNQVSGSGPNGRIIVRDIESVVVAPDDTPTPAALKQESVNIPVSALFSDRDFEVKKLSNMRKIIAKAMHESIINSAQLTHHMSADVRNLQALRIKVKAEMDKGSNVNITLNDMVCFSVIRALEKYPDVNSHFMGDAVKTFKNINLGLAVDTPRGLMVPVVLNAGELSLKGLANRMHDLADQCKKGSVNPELLASAAGSFTVSNLGNYGVEIFTPIINLPQVAILGVNTITYRAADLGGGVFGFVPVIGLSLTYDHRALDGGQATLFLREIKMQIENFSEKI